MDKIKYLQEYKDYIKKTRPKRDLYRTVSGKKVFSNEYQLIVPNDFDDRSFASVAGTAFDYMARFIIARFCYNYKEESLTDLKSTEGLNSFEGDLREEFNEVNISIIDRLRNFIFNKSELNLNTLARYCCFLARLEHCARTNWTPNESLINFMRVENKEIILELVKMAALFYKNFIISGMVKIDSEIVYNPKFGKCSKFLEGADADIFIDGVLWDFKTTKNFLSKSDDEVQLWQYYIYDKACKMADDASSSLFDFDIKAVAFYKARFGEIEFLKISKINYNLIYSAVKMTIERMMTIRMNEQNVKGHIKPFF